MRLFVRMIQRLLFALLLASVASTLLLGVSASPRPHQPRSEGTAAHGAAGSFAHLPITFERNVGQADSHVRFLSRIPGATLLLESSGVRLSFAQPSTSQNNSLCVSFPGSLGNVSPEPANQVETKTNYYFGRDPAGWHTDVPNYASVRYSNIFNGVDLVFHGTQGNLEYDFVVKPGADTSAIEMRLSGSGVPQISDGAVRIQTPSGVLEFKQPTIYQEIGGNRLFVQGRFISRGYRRFGFKIGRYDHSLPLVIDPVLSYSTFFASQGETDVAGVARDAAGEIFLAGSTAGIRLPIEQPFQSQLNGVKDAFISKISEDGSTLVYSTYFGGSSQDEAVALALDTQGDAFITGDTSSSDFPTTPNSFGPTCIMVGSSCGGSYVAKFGPTGSLVYSTFLSPSAGSRAIAVGSDGSAYLTGTTSGTGLDLVNAFETQPGAGFVQKLDPTGSKLIYSTYLQPTNATELGPAMEPDAIAVDAAGSAYVAGEAPGNSFPTRNNSPTLNSDNGFFVVKFKPDGSDLVYSATIGGTYPGLNLYEVHGIAVDQSGNAYVAGRTDSTDFPTTPNAFIPDCCAGGNDALAIALKISADGSALNYSTFLGSSIATGIAVDSSGQAYVIGSTTLPTSPLINAVESLSSYNNAYVTALDASGVPFFATALGTSVNSSSGVGIAVSPAGDSIVVTGNTPVGSVDDFPLVNPPQSFFTYCCGVNGAFISIINPLSAGPLISASPLFTPVVTLRNVSSNPLLVTGITSSGSAPLDGDCLPAHTLAAASSCYLVVGDDSINLTVTSNAPGSPQTFAISSQFPSIDIPPGLSASPINSVFPTQLVDTSSAPQTVILTNLATTPSQINAIELDPGSITQSNNCPAVLASGAHCAFQITFAPTTTGTLSSTINIIHDGAPTPFTIGAGGTAVTNALIISTPDINFESQYVGDSYLPRTIAATNVGPTPLTITGIILRICISKRTTARL